MGDVSSSQWQPLGSGLAGLVDLYPTLYELCRLPVPDGLEGTSSGPLLREPERPWKSAVSNQAAPRGITGYAIRTDRYRYMEWRQDGEVAAAELSDHATDHGERRNLAAEPGRGRLLHTLKTRLDAGWRHALPPQQTAAPATP